MLAHTLKHKTTVGRQLYGCFLRQLSNTSQFRCHMFATQVPFQSVDGHLSRSRPISPIVSVALQGFCIEILYMPSNTEIKPALWPPGLTPLKSLSMSLVMAEGKCNQAPVPLLWLGERSCWREGLEMSVPDDGWDRCRFYGTEMRSLTDDPACSNSWDLARHARVQQKYFNSPFD